MRAGQNQTGLFTFISLLASEQRRHWSDCAYHGLHLSLNTTKQTKWHEDSTIALSQNGEVSIMGLGRLRRWWLSLFQFCQYTKQACCSSPPGIRALLLDSSTDSFRYTGTTIIHDQWRNQKLTLNPTRLDSLGIRTIWSESLCAVWVANDLNFRQSYSEEHKTSHVWTLWIAFEFHFWMSTL